jgi:hypothetical protein
MSEEAEQKHIGTPTQRGECPRRAQAEHLIRGLWLMQTIQSDLGLLDVPLPDGLD